jgi:hypothetical protein
VHPLDGGTLGAHHRRARRNGGLLTEVLEAIPRPQRVIAGNGGELLAVREVEARKWLVATHREFKEDGFVITAFLTRRQSGLERRRQIWP